MKTIGIVGGGQLGRMLVIAARKLGFKTVVLDPTPNSPAGLVADKQILGSFKDPKAIRELSLECDFMTFELESADADTLHELKKEGKEIHPSPETLLIIKDKFKQKKFLETHKIPVADSLEINSEEEAIEAGEKLGYPFLLKARFDAYDGRGNALVLSEEEIPDAFLKLGGKLLYAEKFVPFEKEISVVAARDIKGIVKVFPVVETVHKNNICHHVYAPARITSESKTKAEDLASCVMNAIDGVGVFGIEMFLTKDGEVFVNEIAPRVHNSGHHTIEANATSQFEQHIRAISGLELGETDLEVPASVMINILGERSGTARLEGLETVDEMPGVSVHIYGKVEIRPERKMGHITVVADTHEEALEKAIKARKQISI